jgi:hypothetical protein
MSENSRQTHKQSFLRRINSQEALLILQKLDRSE